MEVSTIHKRTNNYNGQKNSSNNSFHYRSYTLDLNIKSGQETEVKQLAKNGETNCMEVIYKVLYSLFK